MSDISNKTLVALLVIAIVVSLAGTWISIGKLKTITGQYVVGQPNAPGTVQLTGQAQVEITLYNETIDFGTGRVNATGGNKYCTINTTMVASSTSNAGNTPFAPTFSGTKDGVDKCIGFSIPGQGFEVVNTGTVEVDVNMNSSSGDTWIDGPSNDGWYQYRMSDENAGCSNGDETTWTNITTGMYSSVCGNLSTDTSKNAFQVAIQVKVPVDLANGSHSDTVTFTAIDST